MEQLQCNIVVMKNSQANILRLNLVGSDASKPVATSSKQSFDGFSWENEYLRLSTGQKMMLQPLIRKIFGSDGQSFENLDESCNPAADNCNLREVISPSRRAPPGPPPLCSIYMPTQVTCVREASKRVHVCRARACNGGLLTG